MTRPSQDFAQASPTKQFFVSMLTRDISLDDAILDLLDNCLDGAMRIADLDSIDDARHFVKVKLARYAFSIEGNCGSILSEAAIDYALKMRREPKGECDSDMDTARLGAAHFRELHRNGDEERQAAAPMARRRASKGSTKVANQFALALVGAPEAEPTASKARAAVPARKISKRSSR